MPNRIYSWREWLDGEVHILERGIHFEKSPDAFAKTVRKYAGRIGMQATTHKDGDTVQVQFFDADEV